MRNKVNGIIGILTLLILNSCQFNQSIEKDLSTGAYIRGDGIGCEDVLIEINGKGTNRNEFSYREKVDLVFYNVSGLAKKDDKVYPNLSLYIVRNEQDTVASHDNLLKEINKGTSITPLNLSANFRAGFPFENNEKYKVFATITDKKSDGKLSYELPFTIKENKLLEIENNQVEFSDIYLWSETTQQPVHDKQIKADDLFYLIFEDLEGFELKNGKIFPVFSLEITDNKGNKILSNPNLLADYEKEGVDPKTLKEQLYAKITFTKGAINNPCRLVSNLKDKNSKKEIKVTTELIIN